jgi:hypothetical protein
MSQPAGGAAFNMLAMLAAAQQGVGDEEGGGGGAEAGEGEAYVSLSQHKSAADDQMSYRATMTVAAPPPPPRPHTLVPPQLNPKTSRKYGQSGPVRAAVSTLSLSQLGAI